MRLRLSEIAGMLNLPPAPADAEVSGYSIDSRTLKPGDLFFALRGPRFDGHDFIEAALRAGAAAVVAEADHAGAQQSQGNVLAVPDVAEALAKLAHQARRRWGRQVVGITGSNGKTTTKDAISALLATRCRVSKSAGNLNNEYGLPLSVLRTEDDAEIAVLEMGMNHRGEILRLASIAEPNVGVVTNVSSAHLGFFSSVEEIALAKRELIESLPADGVAVLNADDERVRRFAESHSGRTILFGLQSSADFVAQDIVMRGVYGAAFKLARKGSAEAPVPFRSPLVGRHNVANVLAALATAWVFGIEPAALAEAVAGLPVPPMRGEVRELAGAVILNDCYNANPKAMAAMLEVLSETPARRRIAVLGEMLELGAESARLHRELGREAARRGVDVLLAVQGEAREAVEEAARQGFAGPARFFENAEEAGEFLAREIRQGDAVLLKGSRGVGLEKALAVIERAMERQGVTP